MFDEGTRHAQSLRDLSRLSRERFAAVQQHALADAQRPMSPNRNQALVVPGAFIKHPVIARSRGCLAHLTLSRFTAHLLALLIHYENPARVQDLGAVYGVVAGLHILRDRG
jgi:hypothetical protein